MCLDREYQPMNLDQVTANRGKAYANRYSGPDRNIVNKTGAADHRAFTRYITNEHPVIGAPAMLAAIPAYNAAKKIGILRGGQDPSMYSMAEAYRGVGEGLRDVLSRPRL